MRHASLSLSNLFSHHAGALACKMSFPDESTHILTNCLYEDIKYFL